MPASTLDDVVARLSDITVQAIEAGDRRGYFAALYNRVTQSVRAGIAQGIFEDGPRMARLDVVFANRYLDAYDRYDRGEATSAVWKLAFDAARADGLFVLHHLLLGMNAHIFLDLGIAAVEVAPGASIDGLASDFQRINDVLASLLKTVEDELTDVAGRFDPPLGHVLRILERASYGEEQSAAHVLLNAAREEAWLFAKDLARLDEARQIERTATQDRRAALVADALLLARPAIELLAHGGSSDVAGNLRILAR